MKRILEDFIISFISTFIAEFGDKSQISLFLLSAKTKMHLHLLFGAFIAFLIVDGFAILIGYSALSFIPVSITKIVSGFIFIILGAFYLMRKLRKEKKYVKLISPFYSGFIVTFFSEWGDKTQIVAALFATTFNPIAVLLGVLSSLFLLSYLFVSLGKLIHNRFDRNILEKISGLIFIVIGLTFLLSV